MVRLFVAGLLFIAACSKSDAPAEKTSAEKPAPTAEKPVKADPVAPAVVDQTPPAKVKQATNAGDLGKLPIDSEVVVGVNVAGIKVSPLWRDIIAPRVMTGDVTARLDELKQKCGIDPMEIVQSASVGLKGQDGVIVVHGPEKAKLAACAEKMKSDKDSKIEVAQDGDATILKPKTGGVAVAYQFISDTDAVVTIGSKASAAGLKTIIGGTGLAASKAFVDMYNRLDTEKSVWMLMNGNNPAFKPLAMAGIKPTHVYGNLDASNGINLELRMRLASQDQATQSATMMKAQLGPAAGMLKMDKLDVIADGQDLKFIMLVSRANIGPMMSALQSLGAMGGGGAMGKP